MRNRAPVTPDRREAEVMISDYLQLYVFGSRMLAAGLVLVGVWEWLHPTMALS